MAGYWIRVLERRVSRRHALATAAVAALLGATDAFPLAAQPGTDAESIAGVRWNGQRDGEQVVIDLGRSDGSQADQPGRVSAEFLRDQGIVRVHVDDAVTTVGKTPQEMMELTAPKYADLGGALAGQAFIVRAENGSSLFIDIHVAAPAEAQLSEAGAPARVMVDLTPGGGPVGSTTQSLFRTPDPHGTVILTPQPGETASYPLRVSGYTRTFEANIVAQVRQGGRMIAATSGIASDWLKAWGAFDLAIKVGPMGPVEIFVGDYSPAYGQEEGIYVPLTMQ